MLVKVKRALRGTLSPIWTAQHVKLGTYPLPSRESLCLSLVNDLNI